MARDENWRKKELSLEEVIKKYPELPPIWILKVDVQRRGVVYSEEAKKKIDLNVHQVKKINGCVNARIDDKGEDFSQDGLILRDGSYLVTNHENDVHNLQRDPYVVDVVDDKIVITDQGKVLEEVEYWEKPFFYNKLASNGNPMLQYITARPQRVDIFLNGYCHFWDKPGEGCKYCGVTPTYKMSGREEERYNLKYIAESIHEAFKQAGRYSSIMITGGSILSGEELFEDEVDLYIDLLKLIGENFATRRFPSQLISSAYNRRQLEKLYENTGLLTYTTDIEVLNKEAFEWICPGKANHVGFEEWKRRLYEAVDVFGKGNVSSGLVLGVEQAKPNGFKTEDDAYKAVVEEAEEIISHGVSLAANVWRTAQGSIFVKQDTPSLDYYVRAFKKFDDLHHKYGVGQYVDDYRRCGAHPGLDLLRI